MSAPKMVASVKQLLTASQCAVVRSGAGRLLVGAGAGSGKTSTVVQSICHRLGATVTDAEGRTFAPEVILELRDIAAITFTNQAAADLKRKLRQALRQAGLGEAARDVDTARIGTIHSFCGDVVREFALQAGRRPLVTVLDDAQSASLTRDAAQSTLLEAIAVRGVDWLEPLRQGRQHGHIAGLIGDLAVDTSRLTAYAAGAGALRAHESRLMILAQRCAEIRHAQMDAQGAYDFDGILLAARDLLRDDTEVRLGLQRRIRLLIVDEFQDVDPVQRDIVMLLAGVAVNDPEPSSLMLVGDPKQSIFRFRRADVTLWNDVATTFGSNDSEGKTIELSENFRSRKGILAFVDQVFGSALDRPVYPTAVRTAFEVDYRPLRAAGPDAEGDECVELRCVPPAADGKERGAPEVRALEARDVALRIEALVGGGEVYGDIAILLSGWGDLEVYESALRARGIPAYALRSEGFWESREILDCVLALRAIRDVDGAVDRAGLIGFLRSPFVGVRDDTLLSLAKHPAGLRRAMRTETRERPLLDRACALLDRFSNLRDRMPHGELLQRLVSESGFGAVLALDPVGGRQALANIGKLERLATAGGSLSLGEWLLQVSEQRETGVKVSHERLYRERADVVTISSIHSAKGLEWPVVFWCDMVRTGKPAADPLLMGRDRFTLKDPLQSSDGEADRDPVHDDHAADLALEAEAEAYRLWYVAATRPRRLLVLSGIALPVAAPKPPKPDPKRPTSFTGCPAALVRAAFASELGAAELPAVIQYQHTDGTSFRMKVAAVAVEDADSDDESSSSPKAGALDATGFIAQQSIACRKGRRQLSATQLLKFSREQEAADALTRWKRAPAASSDTKWVVSSNATLSGTLVHDVLEHWHDGLGDIESLVAAAMSRHATGVADSALHDALQSAVSTLVQQVIAHPRWRELADSPSARRELSFTRVLPDGSTVQGALDLATVVDGETLILDVKSGAAKDSVQLIETYQIQAATYGDAATAITGGRPTRFEILQAADGLTIPIDAPETLMHELINLVRGEGA